MHPALIKLENSFKPSILTKLGDPLLDEYQIELWIKRDDLLHPIISGNKWRKLKYSLDHALSLGSDTLISMGGTYSNHLHALAYAGKILGLKTKAFIRGEQPTTLTSTLIDIQNWGMEISFVSRSDYKLLRQYKNCHDLPALKPSQYWIPEGGAQILALKGVAELINEIDITYDILCVPCGTGATLAGIINAAPDKASILGFAALKNAAFLESDVTRLLPKISSDNWKVNLDYHFGGFAKKSTELLDFISNFEDKTGIPLESVYTGKMLFGIYDLITKHTFKPGQRIIAIHTGGLQGKRGFTK
jgi:1-aminocyclopropane-1-carboxylate deaminase